MRRRETIFTLLLSIAFTTSAFADCSTPNFNVTNGCAYRGSSAIAAVADGVTNDGPAIQQCLLAAGDFYKTCREGDSTQRENPVEVQFGNGTYFVEGAFRSAIPDTRIPDFPQWIALVMPRGVAVRGNGYANTTITITQGENDSRPYGNTGPRASTFLFVAGMEKVADYCNETTTLQPSGGDSRPLCKDETGNPTTQSERELGGAYNAFYDIRLHGDSEAIVWDQNASHEVEGRSSAVMVTDGYKFKMNNVWVDEWYRGVWVIANGADVRNSYFVNNIKAGLYINGLALATYGRPDHTGEPYYVYNNWMGNEESWLSRMEDLKANSQADWNPHGSLAAIFFNGNVSAACGDLTFDSNRIYRARAVIDPPCGSELSVLNNWFSWSAEPITIGGTDGQMGLLFAHGSIHDNTIDHSLTGITIQGCNWRKDAADLVGRCAERTTNQLDIQDNTMTTFLPFHGVGSDHFVDAAAVSWVGNYGGIALSDISGVTMYGNHIRDLKSGTQMAGLSVQTSFQNARLPGEGWSSLNCYMPFAYNENINAYGNEISYSSDAKANDLLGFPSHAIGYYVENTLNFGADHRDFRFSGYPEAATNAEENRAVNTSISFLGYGFREVLCQRDSDTNCKRAMINGDHYMSTLMHLRLASDSNDPRYYCSQQTKENDEEFQKP
jgi:hypothetical protein